MPTLRDYNRATQPTEEETKKTSAAYSTWQSAITKKVTTLFDSETFSDFRIKCRDRSWNVHKLVISSHSVFFEKACTRDFAEKKQGFVELSDDEPDVVAAMISYFYKMTYESPTDIAGVLFEAKLYVLADKVQVKPLAELANQKFLKKGVRLVSQKSIPASQLVELIGYIYNNTPDNDHHFRGTIVGLTEGYLNAQDGYDPLIVHAAAEIENFGRDLMKYKSRQTKSEHGVKGGFTFKYAFDCGQCGHHTEWVGNALMTSEELNAYICLRCGSDEDEPEHHRYW